jgi:hypothetical protein
VSPASRRSYLLLVLASSALSIGASACVRRTVRSDPPSTSVGNYFRTIEPFSTLGDVRLGMTVADLRRVRPAAVPLAWTGMVEDIAGESIRYYFPEGEPQSLTLRWTPSADDAVLYEVDVVTRFSNLDAAERAWTARGAAVRKRGPVSCFAYEPWHGAQPVNLSRAFRVVISQAAGVTVGTVLGPPTLATDTYWVLTFVSTERPRFLPREPVRQSLPCPGS